MAQTFNISRFLSRRFHINFPPYTWATSHINTYADRASNDSTLVPTSPSIPKDEDVLLSNIRMANSSGELFNIIAAHGQVFNQKHVIESFSCLHEFNKLNRSDTFYHNVTNDPIFEKLCLQLKKYSRVLELNEIIEALKVLTLLNVPPNSTIFQMLLQLIRSNINNLELDQVVFLDYILKKCEPNHLIDAIQLALPLVFQLNVSSKMDRENIAELTKLLRYSSVNNVPMSCVTSIVTAIVIHTNEIDYTSAKSLIFSLTEHRFKSCEFHVVFQKLITRCLDILLANITSLTFQDILKIMERLKEMIILQHSEFYNVEFFNACGHYVISKDLPFVSAIQVSRLLTRIAHSHLPLLDYITQLLAINSEDIQSFRPRHLIILTSSFSNANYIPDFFDEIKEHIVQNPIISNPQNVRYELPWSKFGMDLAVLDIYDEKFLTKVFNREFLKEFLSRKNTLIDHIQLLTLYQAVKTFRPSIELDLPTEVYKRATGINCSREVDEVMKMALIKNLGGEQYVGSQVQMPYGIFSDFVVAFRDGVYPVAINPNCKEGPIHYNELDLPQQSNVVCIVNHHQGCYSLNNKRLRGQFDLINRALEKLGYKVLPIALNDWHSMQDIEKTLYIMREIKYKFSQNSGDANDTNNNLNVT